MPGGANGKLANISGQRREQIWCADLQLLNTAAISWGLQIHHPPVGFYPSFSQRGPHSTPSRSVGPTPPPPEWTEHDDGTHSLSEQRARACGFRLAGSAANKTL